MKREDELVAAGWERRFIACEPRLSEMVATYKEIGFAVLLEPLPSKDEMDKASCDESGCTACYDADPEKYRIIFTRKA